MRRTTGLVLALLALAFLADSRLALAQEESKPDTSDSKPTERHNPSGQPGAPGGVVQPIHPYRVEFLITELENGKKINSRRYLMLLNAGNGWNQMKIGTRVPVGPDVPGQFLDVGTNINCRVVEQGSDLELDVRSDFSNFFSGPNPDHSGKPIVQQINIYGNTLVTSGKAVTIGIVDDPSSDRQFQLDATVTRLR